MLSEPAAILLFIAIVIGLVTVFFWFGERRIRQRELVEIERFDALPRTSDEAFLKDLGIAPASRFAKQALAIRQTIAELATVSSESLGSSLRPFSDMNRLPFFDSPDIMGVILEIEEKIGVTIKDDFQEDLCLAISQGTIRDVVRVVIEHLQKG